MGFPAHAGMDRIRMENSGHHQRLPRTRGDGPDRSPRSPRL